MGPDLYTLANNIILLSDEDRNKLSKIISDIDKNCKVNTISVIDENDEITYDLVLNSPGKFKVRLMSRLCQLLKFSLSEAKEIVYNTPSVIEPNVLKDDVKKLIKDLSDEGVEFILTKRKN